MCVNEMAEAMMCAADDGGEVKFAEPAGAERGFEDGAGEPEGEHAEEDGENALLDEGVGEELPDFAVGDGAGLEHEVAEEEVCDVRSQPAKENDARRRPRRSRG